VEAWIIWDQPLKKTPFFVLLYAFNFHDLFLWKPAAIIPNPHHVSSCHHIPPQCADSRGKSPGLCVVVAQWDLYVVILKERLLVLISALTPQCMTSIQTHDLLRKFILFLSREEQCLDICVCLEGSHTLCLLGMVFEWLRLTLSIWNFGYNLNAYHVSWLILS